MKRKMTVFGWLVIVLCALLIAQVVWGMIGDHPLGERLLNMLSLFCVVAILSLGAAWKFKHSISSGAFILLTSVIHVLLGVIFNNRLAPMQWMNNLSMVLFVVSGVVVSIQLLGLFFRRDIGIQFIGLGLLVLMLGVLVLWLLTGDVLVLILTTIVGQGPLHNGLWLIALMIVWLLWLTPLAVISALINTFNALCEEWAE